MITLLKGMGKAYLKNQKIKKADKLYESKRTDRYAPNEKNLSEETKKVNKQLKTAKNIAIGTGGAMAAAGVYGKAKQAFKEKD
jgi:hypothetical protein